jgi:hypothetical protein
MVAPRVTYRQSPPSGITKRVLRRRGAGHSAARRGATRDCAASAKDALQREILTLHACMQSENLDSRGHSAT